MISTYGKDFRKFMRRVRASDMDKFLKTGCDMGWYGHFIQPIKTPEIDKVLRRILNDIQERTPAHFTKTADKHFWELA